MAQTYYAWLRYILGGTGQPDALISTLAANAEQHQFRISPDPANAYTPLESREPLDGPARVALFNSVGQLALEKNWPPGLSQGLELDLAGLPDGTYFLQITMSDQRIVFKRLVVAHRTP